MSRINSRAGATVAPAHNSEGERMESLVWLVLVAIVAKLVDLCEE